ncbi:MAG: FAD-binding oxidoreductase [Bacteroidota bacterium]
MMKKKYTKREFLQLLVAAGFTLYLPACDFKSNKDNNGKDNDNNNDNTSPKNTQTKSSHEENPEPEIPKDTRDALEKAMESNNVIYLQKQDEDYEKNRSTYNLHIQKYPAIIALCKNTEGVAEAIRLAKAKAWKVAVKSGGHSFEGFSSINDGLQINLTLMNKMKWESDEVISMQPACLLKDIYDEILPKQRILPSGSCGTVGIAGLTLGGGYGFFSRKHGLTCDNLVAATMVDGEANIHTTRSGDELMWALRGGGNGNFGVVTELQFQTHPAPDGFTRYRFRAYKLHKERAKKLFEKYFELSANLSETCFAAFVLNHRTLTILITNYGKKDKALDDMVAELDNLMDDASIGSKRELAKALRSYYGRPEPLYFKNASAGYYDDYQALLPSLDDILDVVLNTRRLIFQINTLGGNIDRPDFEQQSCYPHRAIPYLSELQAYWEKKIDPQYLFTAFEKIQSIVFQNGITRQYRNYPYLGFKNWETAYYGEENYTKLQAIKSKYDPQDIFSNEQTVRGKEV